jgi:hypothetical protein
MSGSVRGVPGNRHSYRDYFLTIFFLLKLLTKKHIPKKIEPSPFYPSNDLRECVFLGQGEP